MIVAPFGAVSPPAGDWSMTVPAGWFESASRRATAKPAPWSCASADSYGWPSTDGTPIGFGPAETLILTVVPSSTTSPGFGSCAITVFCGSFELTSWTSGFSFAAVSAATASSRERPRTSGTSVVGGPVETNSVTTSVSGEMRFPPSGFWS